MKKILLTLLAAVSVLFVGSANAVELPEVTDHEKITVYLFRGSGCGHCYDFLEYFSDKAADYKDYFEIVSYETWKDQDNSALLSAVSERVGNTETGVPFIVIGDYYKVGFSTASAESIIQEALKAYQDEDYEDVVASVIEDEELTANPETLKEACQSEGIVTDESKISDSVVIIVIFVVLVGGFVGLMFLSKKKA